MRYLQADHAHFYLNEEIFLPKISESLRTYDQEKFDGAVVRLDASCKSPLNWQKQIDEAKRIQEQNGWILWDFYFGLDMPVFSFENTLFFQNISIAVSHFLKENWNHFKKATFGINLFKGDLDFSNYLQWHEGENELFCQWLKEKYPQEFSTEKKMNPEELSPQILRIYSIERLSDYLHRIGALFPEEAVLFSTFNAFSVQSPAMQAQILSKERFPHLYLCASHVKIPLFGLNWHAGLMQGGYLGNQYAEGLKSLETTLAVCLPIDSKCSQAAYEQLDGIFSDMQKNNIPYRVIPEFLLTEQWENLDQLVVCSAFLSEQGMRKMQGFEAAGGRIISYGPKLGLAEEMTWEEFIRSRDANTKCKKQ
ncbi:MAG: hypothetical protein Tsb0015_01650 [Simkaniaceae bacterium]